MLLFETALGTCGIRWSDAGLTRVLLPGTRSLVGDPETAAHDAPESARAAAAAIAALLAGERIDLRWVVLDDHDIEPFRRGVYSATREVPAGAIASYGDIARAIGEPGAARAVGVALARNPFAIVVPCHRVLSSTGALHGFSAPGGVATKRRMLAIEGASGFMQEALFP